MVRLGGQHPPNFDVRIFLELERAIAGIGNLDLEGQVGVQLDIPIVDGLLVHCQGRRPAAAVIVPPTRSDQTGYGSNQ